MKRFSLLKTYLKCALAGTIILGSVAAVMALNVDQTRTVVQRSNVTQQTNYYRLTINYNDPNISTATAFGALAKNTFISNVACHVTTAFNAGTTNVVTIGTSTAANEIINAATSTKSIDESSATYQQITSATSLGLSAMSDADHTLYAKYTQTGTPASAGAVTCVIEFIPNNDL